MKNNKIHLVNITSGFDLKNKFSTIKEKSNYIFDISSLEKKNTRYN